jgi:tetratricopeptide (TPR) repeat protein
MRYPKIFSNCLLLLLMLSLLVYPQAGVATPIQREMPVSNTVQTSSQQVVSYDQILDFLEELEEGDWECNPDELANIHHFLVSLSTQGLLPHDAEAAAILERDIQELVEESFDSYTYTHILYQDGEYVIIPAILHGQKGDIILCGGWFKKKWKQIKKFIEEHKEEIILGAAIVVAAAVVVGVVVAVSAGAAASAATAAGADKHHPSSTPSVVDTVATQDPSQVLAAIREEASTIKEQAVQERFFETNPNHFSAEENGRIFGETLTDQMLKSFGLNLDPHQNMFNAAFSPDPLYSPISVQNLGTDTRENLHQLRGNRAFELFSYDQALADFDRAIALNPHHPDTYLERAKTNLNMGHYPKAIEDFQEYTNRKPLSFGQCWEFSRNFALEVPVGIRDSAKQNYQLFADLVTNPIHTAQGIGEGFAYLAKLASNGNWKALSEALVPEAYELVVHWDSFAFDERGKRSGYIVGKYGTDIFLPLAVGRGGSAVIQEVNAARKIFQAAENTLVLETLSQSKGAMVAEFERACSLEKNLCSSCFLIERPLCESHQIFTNAQRVLKPYSKSYLPEIEVRELIHQTGIRTFPRPNGIPENFRVRVSDKGAGMKYVHPDNTHTHVRVMPGKPHSPNPYQQNPYIVHVKDGNFLDKFGNIVPGAAPEAHIPITEFVYRS